MLIQFLGIPGIMACEIIVYLDFEIPIFPALKITIDTLLIFGIRRKGRMKRNF